MFTTLETARIAASGGGERFMSWQVEDAEANRQGLTIAEYGELGGPGMGGCPAGPADVGAPAGTAQVIRSADGLSAQVSWTPQTAVPDASPVSGYSVLAIDTTVTPAAQAGVRTDAAAKQATIGSLTNGKIYTFEVRSLAQDGSISKPFTIGTAGGGTQTPGAEAGITLTPAGGATTETAVAAGLVTAAGSPAGGQVWFTDDGTAAVTGDALAETAKLYTAPVPVTAPVHLSFAYFNTDGNVAQSSGFYKPGASQPAPAVPKNGRRRLSPPTGHPELGTRHRCHGLPGGGHASACGSHRGDHGHLAGGHGLGAEHRLHVHRQGQERRGHAQRAVRAGVGHHDGHYRPGHDRHRPLEGR